MSVDPSFDPMPGAGRGLADLRDTSTRRRWLVVIGVWMFCLPPAIGAILMLPWGELSLRAWLIVGPVVLVVVLLCGAILWTVTGAVLRSPSR